MSNIKCIDISEWQGSVDFEKVKSQGVDYAILRAGFGRSSSQKDSEFETYYKNAKAAGIKLGAYWYSYAVDAEDAVKEAEAFIKIIKGKSFELPLFYDMEESFQTSLGKSRLTNMAEAFMSKLISSGYKAGIYANANWFENYLDYSKLYGKYPLWLAQYNDVAEFDCDIWQYTSSGKVSGIEGNVDMNIIYNEKLLPEADEKPAETVKTVNVEVAAIQALMMLSNRLGLISQNISPLDNKKGSMTRSAIKQMKKYLAMKEDDSTDLQFIRRSYQALIDALPVVGDVNSDGKINIKDVTALQKRIAGVEDE